MVQNTISKSYRIFVWNYIIIDIDTLIYESNKMNFFATNLILELFLIQLQHVYFIYHFISGSHLRRNVVQLLARILIVRKMCTVQL